MGGGWAVSQQGGGIQVSVGDERARGENSTKPFHKCECLKQISIGLYKIH